METQKEKQAEQSTPTTKVRDPFTEYAGECNKCTISYGPYEIKVGYTLMHNLVSSIDNQMTYFKDLANLTGLLEEIRNRMGSDAEDELVRAEIVKANADMVVELEEHQRRVPSKTPIKFGVRKLKDTL